MVETAAITVMAAAATADEPEGSSSRKSLRAASLSWETAASH